MYTAIQGDAMRLFWFSLAWLAGIGISRSASLSPTHWLILAGCSSAALLAFRRNANTRLLFLLALLWTLGGLRYTTSIPEFGPDHIASYNDRHNRLTIEGVIVASPDIRDKYSGLKIEVEAVYNPQTAISQPMAGTVLVYASPYEIYNYGDKVRVTGPLETPPEFESFSYREYLARQGIHSTMPDPEVVVLGERAGNPLLQAIYDFRTGALQVIHQLFPDPEAALLSGILLGIESGISPDVRHAFDATGTTHIIAISGFNITIISALFISLFGRWLGTRRGAIAACLAISVYTILVGADAAVVRAAIMAGFVLLANRLGRQSHGLASLGGPRKKEKMPSRAGLHFVIRLRRRRRNPIPMPMTEIPATPTMKITSKGKGVGAATLLTIT